MKAIILLGTLKKTGLSNTEVLCEFFQKHLEVQNIECSILKLVEHSILPGTYNDMGEGDDWPHILEQILASDILLLASPIWWNNHSSETQRVIERLDELHDEILEGKESRLLGKVGGVLVTGDSDGAQTIIANVGNFFNAVGITLPPFATLTVLWDRQAKDKKPTKQELLAKYEKEYKATAEKMATQLITYAQLKKKVTA
ncbi:flavodoxin family protein [Nibribacter ruber]|uniref:Flavodoxin family protein n=1 Tax=Nibribacter ruber TaxID=2698458 RepID=A0A6P1NY46_9BACT|nr:flavodoxin family protein [Nibribacter ruber]QHL86855.1 flavodoxin family protein [Nibribacter ruber]